MTKGSPFLRRVRAPRGSCVSNSPFWLERVSSFSRLFRRLHNLLGKSGGCFWGGGDSGCRFRVQSPRGWGLGLLALTPPSTALFRHFSNRRLLRSHLSFPVLWAFSGPPPPPDAGTGLVSCLSPFPPATFLLHFPPPPSCIAFLFRRSPMYKSTCQTPYRWSKFPPAQDPGSPLSVFFTTVHSHFFPFLLIIGIPN